jgi:sialidase-1
MPTRRLSCLFPIFLLTLAELPAQERQYFSEVPLFVNGQGGYACYRIPAVVLAPNGDLLAFAEGRRHGCGDFGDVDIVMRRSRDNGQSWEALEVIVDFGNLQAGNPAPVVDRLDPAFPQGRIFLFYNTGNNHEGEVRRGNGLREVLYVTSIDNGRTWSAPVNITADVHRPRQSEIDPAYNFPEDWRSYANAPGHALQLTRGPHAGRLFVPANHSEGPPQAGFNDYRAHAFYSDDHGRTWRLAETVDIPSSNESIAVELSDGRVMQNIRQQNGEDRSRIVALSSDGGASWDTAFIETQLPCPVCQASIISYTSPYGQNLVLFSNPNSRGNRRNMTVRASIDDGATWALSRQVRSGESAYSDLVVQQDGMIGLLYEHGNDGGIHYAHFNYYWLIGGQNHSDNPWMKKVLEPGVAPSLAFELADPLLTYESAFFQEKTEARLQLDLEGTVIRYTLDGSDPSAGSLVYTEPIVIEQSCELKARAFHPSYRPSGVVGARFIKTGERLPAEEVRLSDPPSDSYPGRGAEALVDLRKGSLDFRDGEWLGFSGDDLELFIALERAVSFEKVTASVLCDPASWIFPPRSVEVWASDNGRDYRLLAREDFPVLEREEPSSLRYLTVDTGPQSARFIRVAVRNTGTIPDWHPGKGTEAWLFVDEVLVK